jgi:hypothetical protein
MPRSTGLRNDRPGEAVHRAILELWLAQIDIERIKRQPQLQDRGEKVARANTTPRSREIAERRGVQER